MLHAITPTTQKESANYALRHIILRPFLITKCIKTNHENILCCQTLPSVVVQNNLLSREVSNMLMVLISGAVSDSTTVC